MNRHSERARKTMHDTFINADAHPRLEDAIAAALAEVEAETIERCAKVCDTLASRVKDFDDRYRRAAGHCAFEIRAQKVKE